MTWYLACAANSCSRSSRGWHCGAAWCARESLSSASELPNILFAIADDWSWPHAGAYGDTVVRTPTFDRLAREGVLFHHAYVSSPSCTPSRGAILTGQWHWRLRGAANLWSVFPDEFATFPEILAQAGYETGVTGKGWGPGRTQTASGPSPVIRFPAFRLSFVSEIRTSRSASGSAVPIRIDRTNSGLESSWGSMWIVSSRWRACRTFPKCAATSPTTMAEVQRFDQFVGAALTTLEEIGVLDHTIVVMTSDNGMPFPRCKSNLYDSGSRMPLAIRWGDSPAGRKSGGRLREFHGFCTDIPGGRWSATAGGHDRPQSAEHCCAATSPDEWTRPAITC